MNTPTPTPIGDTQFAALLADITTSAFRLELQAEYREPTEVDTIERFAAGHPQNPLEVPSLAAWFDQVRRHTAAGRTITRVRVQDEPPTDCQRWEQWIGAWATDAGERLHYTTRSHAHRIGLLPAAGHTDWWLLDDALLILMRFDDHGHRTWTATTTDPDRIQQAQQWRDLALHAVDNGAPAP